MRLCACLEVYLDADQTAGHWVEHWRVHLNYGSGSDSRERSSCADELVPIVLGDDNPEYCCRFRSMHKGQKLGGGMDTVVRVDPQQG